MATAIVTGGASLMGEGIARSLIAQGWRVVAADIDDARLESVVADLEGAPKAFARHLDVRDLSQVEETVSAIAAEFGDVQGLVNVAGGIRTQKAKADLFVNLDPGDWNRVIDGNLYGVLNCCRAALPVMMAGGQGGAIVSISASRGLRGGPKASHYSAAKAAVIGFTQALAQEVGQAGIRVNAVAPGSAESQWRPSIELESNVTNRSPLGRRTSREDIGEMVAFLMSDRASHITGSCLDVSGGTSLH